MTSMNLETGGEDCHGKARRKQTFIEQKKRRVCTEWRKTCSRLAAQSRRKKESQLFKELTALLPLDLSMDGQRDKASVIRLTIAYLHLRGLLDTTDSLMKRPSPGVSDKSHERELLDSALGGFVVLLSLNGKVIFATKGLTTHTGINQMDLIGRSLLEFLHPCDQMEVKDILTRLIGNQEPQKCEVFLRIKKAMNTKLTGWKIIQCSGKKRSSATPGSSCLVLECRVLPIQEITEVDEALNACTFMSVHSPDMTFTYCHSRVVKLIGFRDTDLLGQSVYQYYHPSDCQQIRKAHICLLSKGQVSTGKYRLLHRYGGYVWAETDASLVCNSQTGVPESVVCINYILSEVEQPNLPFLLEKTEQLLKPTSSSYCPETEPAPFPPSRGQEGEKDLKESNEHNSFITHLKQRDGDIQEVECTEIPHNTEGCYDFNCDQCELDLDSLAPYIPMHGEDFLLTPIIDRAMDMPELNTCRPSCSSPSQNLDSSEGTTVLPVKSLNSTQQSVSNSFQTKRISDTNLISTKQWSDSFDLVNKVSKVYDYDPKQHNYQLFSSETKANHWVEEALKFPQPNRVHWNIDGSTPPWICDGHLNHLEPKFRSLPEKTNCPPQKRRHQHEVKTAAALLTLPVLSGWECEVNAPLEHTSYLLQGTEIMAVLDQVASRVPWC
ncbi:hypoxia inducible factor 1 subunit alpha, like 2 [Danio rerio]|uniref:Hypoxia-inducible factor 1-alpha n=1 Tax=Danio rerio TaxID=7955 RepID=A0A8M2B8B7_DANRE|nr:hypoxia inducible factor 1 subunit alpha, like 2 [Danio rerio]XP_005161407.1 hypoxia-inducible factor 1, alpha subunit, like 2 isoform X1 [Danio rerio]|eukprot:NP_001012371.2 hypoxia-inducible factor 1, alpha subunit, like 2 [Danio rerio]